MSKCYMQRCGKICCCPYPFANAERASIMQASRHAAIHSHSCALCLTIVFDVEESLMPTIVGCPPRFAWQVCVPHGFPRSVEKRQTVVHKSIANCYSSPSQRAGNSCSRFARPFLACSTLYRTVCNVVLLKIKKMDNYQQK